jgi:Na+-translocating ferredoxin:NAD+ oxidoreductase RnfG subunit
MSTWVHFITVPTLSVASIASSHAAVYLNVETAQKACFPRATQFTPLEIQLNPEQAKAIEKSSGVRVRVKRLRIWSVKESDSFVGWFLIDEVLGKHEFINYAVGLSPDGGVSTIEIMDYRETYGHEIRRADWRAQFSGKKHGASLKLDADIKNISGATLSCRHIADGVKRLLATYDLVLKK